MKTQRQEFLFADITGKKAFGLVAILLDALINKFLIVLVVLVHAGPLCWCLFEAAIIASVAFVLNGYLPITDSEIGITNRVESETARLYIDRMRGF